MKRNALFLFLGLWTGVVGVNAQNKTTPVCTVEDQPMLVEITEVGEAIPDENGIFQVVELPPEFPGGMKALMEYLKQHIRYPKVCKEQGLQGRVIVQFVVNPDSTISDAQVIKPVNPHFDKEALRVVNAMPKWKPGEQRGKPVRVRFTLPVTFRLPDDTVKVESHKPDFVESIP